MARRHEPLKGGYDVDDNAVRFSNYFHVLRELVHVSCGWLPLEPRLEVKYLLGDHHRVVPGQHDHHRAEVDPAGLAGEVGQVLNGAAGHDVRREVVVDRPVGVEAERLDQAT